MGGDIFGDPACHGNGAQHAGPWFPLDLSGNKIVADPENTPVMIPSCSSPRFHFPFPAFTSPIMGPWTIPTRAISTPTIRSRSISSAHCGIPAAQRRFRSTGLTLDATDQNPPFDSVITGTSSAQTGFAISGQDAHEILWELSGGTVAPGVYGLAYRISGWEHGNMSGPYDPSDVLVVAFDTNGFTGTGGQTLLDAQTAVFAAAVRSLAPFCSLHRH